MNDERFMRRAIELAGRGRGAVAPNPLVGCVLARNGRIIAEGWHARYGSDHAEAAALKKAGSLARGADMFVTLEPCAHVGRTPPCVEAVISSGVRRCVVAMRDPNPLTNGKSLVKMRRAGIEVVTGVCSRQAEALNPEFIKCFSAGIPWTVVKCAMTLDGCIADRFGNSRWITSLQSRETSRLRRQDFMAVMVGIGTVLADDPRLVSKGDILRVVVDSRLRIPENCRLVRSARNNRLLVAACRGVSVAKVRRLKALGVEVVELPGRGGRVDLKALWRELGRRRIISVLVDGGAELTGAVLRCGLADRVHAYMAPSILGDDRALSAFSHSAAVRLKEAQSLRFLRVQTAGEDIFIEAEVV